LIIGNVKLTRFPSSQHGLEDATRDGQRARHSEHNHDPERGHFEGFEKAIMSLETITKSHALRTIT
jgi:hypothetical protein